MKDLLEQNRNKQELIDLLKQVGADGTPRFQVTEVADTAAVFVLGYRSVDVKELDPSSRALVLDFARRLGVAPHDGAEQLHAKAAHYFADHPLPPELVGSLEKLFRSQIALGARRGHQAQAEFARFIGDQLGPVVKAAAPAPGAVRAGTMARLQVDDLIEQILEKKQKER